MYGLSLLSSFRMFMSLSSKIAFIPGVITNSGKYSDEFLLLISPIILVTLTLWPD